MKVWVKRGEFEVFGGILLTSLKPQKAPRGCGGLGVFRLFLALNECRACEGDQHQEAAGEDGAGATKAY